MPERKWYMGIALALVILAVPFAFSRLPHARPALTGPDIPAVGVPDTAQAREVMATMQRAYHLKAVAARTFNVDEFPTVYVDTPDYQLSEDQRNLVSQTLGQQKETGFLTYMQTYYLSWGAGADKLQAAQDKAKSEGRSLTAKEMQALTAANGGRVPAPARTDPIVVEDKLVFESITIDRDKAFVQYDDGAALQKALLIRVQGKWLIAGIWPIQIHF